MSQELQEEEHERGQERDRSDPPAREHEEEPCAHHYADHAGYAPGQVIRPEGMQQRRVHDPRHRDQVGVGGTKEDARVVARRSLCEPAQLVAEEEEVLTRPQQQRCRGDRREPETGQREALGARQGRKSNSGNWAICRRVRGSLARASGW